MKYIDADKIYEKIYALMARYAKFEEGMYMENSTEDAIYYQGKKRMCSEVLSLITSLQQEQSEISETEVVESEATINGIKTKLNTIIFIVSDDLKPGDKVEAIITRKEE